MSGGEFAEDDVLDTFDLCDVLHVGVGISGYAVVEVKCLEINLKAVFCVRFT
jgi:hypothetical protein